MLTLRPYQHEALRVLRETEVRHPLVAWATGLGKTILFGFYVKERTGRYLIVAHRDELIQQAVDKLSLIGLSPGVVKAEMDDCDADGVVASVQTLNQVHRVKRYLQHGRPSIVVCDEAHHSEAETYQRLFAALGCFEEDGPPLLGVTATPTRGDRKPLGNTWDAIVHHMSILDGITSGYLCDFRALRIKVEADFRRLQVSHGDFKDSETEKLLLESQAPETIADAIAEHANGRPTLVFTPTVRVAYEIAAECRRRGIAAEGLDAKTPLDARRGLLRQLRDGSVRVVANCAVLTEGFDEPSISCIVIARPTRSQPFYVQMAGRGARPFPGKSDCLLLDVVGVTTRHDLITASALAQEAPEAARALDEGRTMLEGLRQAEEVQARGRVVAKPIDLWARRKFAWVKTQAGFVLSLGGRDEGWILLVDEPQGWKVWHDNPRAPRVVWQGQSLEYAQGVAEDYVREMGSARLVDREAPWRKLPMTPKQAQALKRWGVPFPRSWTRGEAADALTRAIASIRRQA